MTSKNKPPKKKKKKKKIVFQQKKEMLSKNWLSLLVEWLIILDVRLITGKIDFINTTMHNVAPSYLYPRVLVKVSFC